MTRHQLKICWSEEDKGFIVEVPDLPAVPPGAAPRLMRRAKRRAQSLLGSKQRRLPVAKSLRHRSRSVDSSRTRRP
jgi:hypothetical protein